MDSCKVRAYGPDVAVADAYELAYREAVRALDHQLAALTELRSRASILLATASITVSLLGREALAGARPLIWLAVLCFVLLSACMLVIMWPHPDWRFDTDPQRLLAEHVQREGATVAKLSMSLIAQMAANRVTNARHLAYIARVFRIGTCLLAAQILATVAAAGTAG